MLTLTKPGNFQPKFEVVACFVQFAGKILLLLRQDHKNEPNTYGTPAGKVELGESIDSAMERELFEETGLHNKARYFNTVYVQYNDYDFIYHMYSLELVEEPTITINSKEHKSYIWKTPEEALQENLIQDLDACIQMFFSPENI